MEHVRYSAAACQTDLPNPARRAEMRPNTDRIISMIDSAVAGSAPFLPVKLVVFPEFAHAAPVFASAGELIEKLAVEIPNEHTGRIWEKAREYGIYVQTGSMLEIDKKYKNAIFNTTCLIGPEGILYKYRKVNTWIPYEVHTSPHDIADYEEPLFPVADTPIGKIGAAICYDWLFPEVLRQLAANGAEILVRVSAYMDPWNATEPMDWWTIINRARALENMCYVVASNQAASLKHYPPYSWSGGSMVVDFDGRVLAKASEGAGEKIVVAPVDVSALRHERAAVGPVERAAVLGGAGVLGVFLGQILEFGFLAEVGNDLFRFGFGFHQDVACAIFRLNRFGLGLVIGGLDFGVADRVGFDVVLQIGLGQLVLATDVQRGGQILQATPAADIPELDAEDLEDLDQLAKELEEEAKAESVKPAAGAIPTPPASPAPA